MGTSAFDDARALNRVLFPFDLEGRVSILDSVTQALVSDLLDHFANSRAQVRLHGFTAFRKEVAGARLAGGKSMGLRPTTFPGHAPAEF